MVEPRGRILDDLARLVTDAAGMAQGMRREAETLARGQIDRLLSSMDLVSREELEAVRDMAARARQESEALQLRVAALEVRLAASEAPRPTSGLGGGVDPTRG